MSEFIKLVEVPPVAIEVPPTHNFFSKKGKPVFDYDKRKEDWILFENASVAERKFLLTFEPLIGSDPYNIWSEEYFKLARNLGNLAGQQHIELLLKEQEIIPKELWGTRPVICGTVWKTNKMSENKKPFMCLPEIFLDHDKQWKIHFTWLGDSEMGDAFSYKNYIVRVHY